MKKIIDSEKVKKYIKCQINPYGKPTTKTAYEFGLEIMDYIDNMIPYSDDEE